MASTTVKQQTQLSTKRPETFPNGDVAGRFFCFWRMSDVLRASAETNRVTAAVTPWKAVQRKNSLFQLLPKEMQTSIREQKHENAAASREIKTNKGDPTAFFALRSAMRKPKATKKRHPRTQVVHYD